MDKKDIRVVYMGTPFFAVNALKSIIDDGYNVVGCYTQPDKMQGRSSKLIASPVKECAAAHGIPVFQPEKIRHSDRCSQSSMTT